MISGSPTPSNLAQMDLPPAVLVAQTREWTYPNGAVMPNALRLNGAAVKPVKAAVTCADTACPPGFVWNGAICAGEDVESTAGVLPNSFGCVSFGQLMD